MLRKTNDLVTTPSRGGVAPAGRRAVHDRLVAIQPRNGSCDWFGAEMPGETARCWMLPFHPKGEKAGHGFQTVIPAKAGIHFRCRNKTLHGSPPARGRRCGSILRAFLPANRRQLPELGSFCSRLSRLASCGGFSLIVAGKVGDRARDFRPPQTKNAGQQKRRAGGTEHKSQISPSYASEPSL